MIQKPPLELTGNWKWDIYALAKDRAADFYMYPDQEVLNTIYRHVRSNNYTQILFDFGQEYIKLCLGYFEKIEDYERCALIMKQVEDFNRTQGTQICTRE